MDGVRFRYGAAMAVVCLILCDCALVDQYADRATTYNLEAEQAQEKAILLNIVRASLRRPLQFTTVASILGSTSATGSGGYSAPVAAPFRSSGGAGSYPALSTWTAGASLSGSETFTVPVLDTQEFYQGILKPIPLQYYDLLVQQRYPGDLLINLFMQKIVMRKTAAKCAGNHTEECEHTFINYVSRDENIDEFQTFAHFLLRAGLTTEEATVRKENLLKGAMNINLRLLGATGQAGASGQSTGGAAGDSQSPEPLSKNYVFCFAPRIEKYSLSPNIKCGVSGKKGGIELDVSSPTSTTITLENLGTETKGGRPTIQSLPECDREEREFEKFCQLMLRFAGSGPISFKFYPKSTEAVIYYLGEVARRQLYPDYDESKERIMIATEPDSDKIPLLPCREFLLPGVDPTYCRYLFKIDGGLIPAGAVSVIYNAEGYWVADYPHGGGYSMSSLEIVKQLQAIFSSAKTLPSTTVLSVVNQ
jgi:hypothetical protein